VKQPPPLPPRPTAEPLSQRLVRFIPLQGVILQQWPGQGMVREFRLGEDGCVKLEQRSDGAGIVERHIGPDLKQRIVYTSGGVFVYE